PRPSADTKAPPVPAVATGQLGLEVPPLARALSVEVSPRETALSPGAETRVAVTVRDAKERPVPKAEVTLVVVDEAVLALSGYATPDPLAAFYQALPPETSDASFRPLVHVPPPSGLDLGGLGGLGGRGAGLGGG